MQGKYTTSKLEYADSSGSSSSSSGGGYMSPDIAALMAYMSEMQARSYPQGWNNSWQVTVGATYRWVHSVRLTVRMPARAAMKARPVRRNMSLRIL